MSACDAGDGRFISYFKQYQHWTFPKHSHTRFVSLNVNRISIILNGIWNPTGNLPESFSNARYMPQHMSYVRIQSRVHVKFDSENIVEQTRHYRTHSTLVCHYFGHSWYTRTELRLMWNRHRAISNHHAHLIIVILHVSGIMSHPLNNARERSRGRPPASFFDKFREALKLDANWSSPEETDKQCQMDL